MNTEKNLKEAFAGESQANQKYLAFAKKADEEGYSSVAKLFRAAAAAESIHAYSELKYIWVIISTSYNLLNGIIGFEYVFTHL
jgi:rubrerythrin